MPKDANRIDLLPPGQLRRQLPVRHLSGGIAHIWEREFAIIPLCINYLSERQRDPLIQATDQRRIFHPGSAGVSAAIGSLNPAYLGSAFHVSRSSSTSRTF